MINIIVYFTGMGLSIFWGTGFTKAEVSIHYPLVRPQQQKWSFSGPFGVYDRAQLQRGLKVYTEICATCHSLKFVAFHNLRALNYDEQEIKSFSNQFAIKDGPNEEGNIFTRPANPTDHFPAPFANDIQAAFANNGAIPSDLSLIARARAVPRPFPNCLTDILKNYTTAGADYIHALLTGYETTLSLEQKISAGKWYNPFFISGESIAMAPPLYDGRIVYDDGSPQTRDQYARDIAAFLTWTADPHMETRKKYGLRVIIFLTLYTGLIFFVKRRIWADYDKGHRS
ncbi:MAG: ubiquinol-cytochrome c reductase cytochrome c1 subunit [Candidatus Tokpelaia sp. JSC085]|nr:MAG: ubiquinol-cytochrome c reductase cytochrome c1 subunit [Candidatus Tokpelaia sp. JSC085]